MISCFAAFNKNISKAITHLCEQNFLIDREYFKSYCHTVYQQSSTSILWCIYFHHCQCFKNDILTD